MVDMSAGEEGAQLGVEDLDFVELDMELFQWLVKQVPWEYNMELKVLVKEEYDMEL